jgi:hypothetical protein
MKQFLHTHFCDFVSKGFALLDGSAILGMISLNDIYIVNVEHVDGVDDIPKVKRTFSELRQFAKIKKFIQSEFIDPIFPIYEIVSYNIWEGVDSGSLKFHNDSAEGQSFCFLIYLDSQFEATGGAIHFKYPFGEDTVYPKAGDVAWVNQQTKFQHKADRSSLRRRVICIEVNVPQWI